MDASEDVQNFRDELTSLFQYHCIEYPPLGPPEVSTMVLEADPMEFHYLPNQVKFKVGIEYRHFLLRINVTATLLSYDKHGTKWSPVVTKQDWESL